MADDAAKGSRGISAGGLIGGATAVITALAALIGVLNQLGYVGRHDVKSAVDVAEPIPSIVKPGAQSPAASATLAMIEPKLSSLTGAWRDSGMGACHLIAQNGANLTITNYYPDSTDVLSHGEGTITGDHVELRLKTMRGEYQLSADGRILRGTATRASGDRPSLWQYVGPACPKTS